MPASPTAETVTKLNLVRLIAVADFLLLIVLVYVAFIDRSDSAVSIIGPIHGVGFLAQLYLVATGAAEERWGWWFPAIVVVTGGPIGAPIGDVRIRRELAEPATA
jgi:integral membrane protein